MREVGVFPASMPLRGFPVPAERLPPVPLSPYVSWLVSRTAPLALSLTLSFALPVNAQQTPYLHAPSVDSYARFDPEGTTIMTTGRLLKPVGKHVPVAQWPHGLTLSPDGKTAFVASAGVGQLITDWQGDTPVVT